MSGWGFIRTTILSPDSPACLWRRPGQASRVLLGALGNAALRLMGRLPGGRKECPLCGWRGRSYLTFLSPDEIIPHCICPECGSFDRQRLLGLAVRRELDRLGRRPGVLLGFSLSPAMRRFLEREGIGRCFRADLAPDGPFAADFAADLRAVGAADGAADWIFCSHVLEHVAELDACLAEIARLLRPGGIAWIQVPLEPGLARSRRIPIAPLRAHAHAWQFGADFASLVARPAWSVEEQPAAVFGDPERRARWGIDPAERCWLLRRR